MECLRKKVHLWISFDGEPIQDRFRLAWVSTQLGTETEPYLWEVWEHWSNWISVLRWIHYFSYDRATLRREKLGEEDAIPGKSNRSNDCLLFHHCEQKLELHSRLLPSCWSLCWRQNRSWGKLPERIHPKRKVALCNHFSKLRRSFPNVFLSYILAPYQRLVSFARMWLYSRMRNHISGGSLHPWKSKMVVCQ